ncbi:MAG: diguanylate cyclase [Actinomycetes bacterium]
MGDFVSERGGDASSSDATRLRALLDIAKVVGAISRFEDLIELTAEEARRALDAASLSVSRWEREQGVFRILVNVGVLGPREVRFPDTEFYAAADYPQAYTLIESRRGYVATLDDADEEAALLAALDKDSSIGIPIVVDARVWGAIYATRTPGQRRFAPSDLDFAVAVATQVAAGVVQADYLARIAKLAYQDPLTGLANRRAVDERLEAGLAEHAEHGSPVSLVLADINRLKQVNDSFGHEAGDRLIVAVADAVSRASGLAQDSLAARIGGDEFCIVTVGAPAEVALRVAEELCRLVEQQPMSTGISCGVASTDGGAVTFDSPVRLFRLADAAQYRAKRAGSRTPVVAGSAAPEGPEIPVDRRLRRGRLSVDAEAILESGYELLDGLAGCGAQTRLEAIADHVLLILDAAAWWVSEVSSDGRDLVSVSSSVQRFAEHRDEIAVAQAQIGARFVLADYPASRRAIEEASAFRVELAAAGNDPAEEESLTLAGYTGVVAAGAAGAAGGWLLEVFADHISMSLAGFEPVLRSLVAVAVAGAAPQLSPAHLAVPALAEELGLALGHELASSSELVPGLAVARDPGAPHELATRLAPRLPSQPTSDADR